MSDKEEVAVIGAGLAGCLVACFLARRGYPVALYERRPDPRKGTVERGRSINLALSERGLDALRRIGLDQEVMAGALPMRGRMIHPVEGELTFQPYSVGGDRAINSISRGALNNALLNAAAALPGVRVAFDHRLVGLDPETGQMAFETQNSRRSRSSAEGASDAVGGHSSRRSRSSAEGASDAVGDVLKVQASASVVLGADGAGSAVRGQMLAYGGLTESLDFLDYGYKELTIPPLITPAPVRRSAAEPAVVGPESVGTDFALAPDALHIWPRGTSMMIALPNPDRSFTCTLFWPNSGPASFASLGSPAAIERHFRTHYPDVLALAPDLVDDYLHNPVGLLGTVRCTPWQLNGTVGLLGDAAHAIVPFYGQGANCAFEDVVELDRCLDDTGDTWEMALPLFEIRRKDNAEAIARMALANFVEMRDKVASPVFQLGKKIEHALERALPGRYVSRYELVSFSTTPYSEVQRRVRRQHRVLGGVMAGAAAALIGALGVAASRSRRDA